MGRLWLVLALLFGSFPFADAQEKQICEANDLYDLTQGCPLSDLRSRYGKTEVRDIMFEILKTYPYDQRDKFAGLLERKIALLAQGSQEGENSWKSGARERLGYHLELVRNATALDWEKTRDAARSELAAVDQQYQSGG